jgi:hypothetical protein
MLHKGILMSLYQFYVPYVAILWKSLPNVSFEKVRSLGFDGIECFLIGNLLSAEALKVVRAKASDAGLGIRFHQGWSWNTGQKILINYMLRPMRALTPEGSSLVEQFQNVGNDDVVVYGNLAMTENNIPSNYVFQTASQHIDGVHYAMPISNFLTTVKKKKLRVVFDTQHLLEWTADAHSVASLPHNGDALTRQLIEAWRQYAPYVTEIHLCDCNPKLGPTSGRNVFPGTGVIDLKAFCEEVKKTSWSGVVTPEVKPEHIANERMLGKMLDVVKGYF